MKTSFYLILAFVGLATVVPAGTISFKDLWYDGNAEISTYTLSESRYGEMRQGTRIMVFVTEPMRLSTHIKPDALPPTEQMIQVIKLNDLRKFITGIYDYSVMTSVFAAVETKGPYENMATMKVAFSSQEWCGQVYDRYVRTPDTYDGAQFSYFETEGESRYSFPAKNVETEEGLWLRARELNGTWLQEGKPITLQILPSRWMLRKSHVPGKTVPAVISKGPQQVRSTTLGKIKVTTIQWTIEGASTTLSVEVDYPHRIVEFRERDGSSGTLIASKREPYWSQNKAAFTAKRKEFGLDVP